MEHVGRVFDNLFKPKVELWYVPEEDNFVLFYPGDFFEPHWVIYHRSGHYMRWILHSPVGNGDRTVLVDDSFCEIQEVGNNNLKNRSQRRAK